MSHRQQAASVSSVKPEINDKDTTVSSSSKQNTNNMSANSRAQKEMEHVGRNTETTNIVSNGTKDSYSATKEGNSSSEDNSKALSKTRKSSDKSGKKSPRKTQVDSFDEDNVCALRPKDENIMDHMPFYQKCHHKFACKVFVFLVIGLLNIADLVSDWLLYRDVVLTENGLVYGPVEPALQWSLLAFSIVGSLTFTFEVANLWWEIFRNNPWMDSDLMSAITVWIEDVPQIAINVAIVACREEAISYFQLVKASVINLGAIIRISVSLFKYCSRRARQDLNYFQLVKASVIILGAIIRIAVSLFKYCSRRARHDLKCAKQNKQSLRHVIYRAFIVTGLFLTLGGAIAVFLFTQSERNPDGSINFKVPHSAISGEFDDQKYFQNVSIYFSNDLVDLNTPPAQEKDIDLINLVRINKVRKKDYNVIVKVLSMNVGLTRKYTVIQTDTETADKNQDCFEVNLQSGVIDLGSNCDHYIKTPESELIFVFHFIQAKIPGLVFGDITYNVKKKIATTCSDISFTIVDDIEKRISDLSTAAMHYFRTDNVATEHPIIHVSATKGKYYHATDLIDVKDLWQTGYATCKSSGSAAPHHDHSINVPC